MDHLVDVVYGRYNSYGILISQYIFILILSNFYVLFYKYQKCDENVIILKYT